MLLPSAFLSSRNFCFYNVNVSFSFLTPACAVLLSCHTVLSRIYCFSLSSLSAPHVHQWFLFIFYNTTSFPGLQRSFRSFFHPPSALQSCTGNRRAGGCCGVRLRNTRKQQPEQISSQQKRQERNPLFPHFPVPAPDTLCQGICRGRKQRVRQKQQHRRKSKPDP